MNSRTGSVVVAIMTIAPAPPKRMPTGFEPEKSSSMLHYPRSSVFIGGYLVFRLEVHHE
jgi:hypothetical protein